MTVVSKSTPAAPEPPWEIARLFPTQGNWGEGDYFALNQITNGLVELADGRVEVLEMPTRSHQRLVLFLRDALKLFSDRSRPGEVLVAPYPVRTGDGRFREPDVLFVSAEHADQLGEEFCDAPDLVMEVISRDRERDLITKKAEYAQAGIAEYWIVDPENRRVIVLELQAGRYVEQSRCEAAGRAKSAILEGFEIEVGELFSAMG